MFQLVIGQLIFFLMASGVLCVRLVADLGSSCRRVCHFVVNIQFATIMHNVNYADI